MDKSCHQEGLAGTHRQAKDIVGIAHPIENIAKSLLIVNRFWIILNKLFHQRSQLPTVAIRHPRILKESLGGRVTHQHLAGNVTDLQRVKVKTVKGAFTEQLP